MTIIHIYYLIHQDFKEAPRNIQKMRHEEKIVPLALNYKCLHINYNVFVQVTYCGKNEKNQTILCNFHF